MTADQTGRERVILHRRDCRKTGGYGELRSDFSPWIECHSYGHPHDPEVEHLELVPAAALAAAEKKIEYLLTLQDHGALRALTDANLRAEQAEARVERLNAELGNAKDENLTLQKERLRNFVQAERFRSAFAGLKIAHDSYEKTLIKAVLKASATGNRELVVETANSLVMAVKGCVAALGEREKASTVQENEP